MMLYKYDDMLCFSRYAAERNASSSFAVSIATVVFGTFFKLLVGNEKAPAPAPLPPPPKKKSSNMNKKLKPFFLFVRPRPSKCCLLLYRVPPYNVPYSVPYNGNNVHVVTVYGLVYALWCYALNGVCDVYNIVINRG